MTFQLAIIYLFSFVPFSPRALSGIGKFCWHFVQKLLDKRVEAFIQANENVFGSASSALAQDWEALKGDVVNTRQNIEDAKKYFILADHVSPI